MRVTRRFWTVAGLGGVLVAGAVLFARLVLLAGAAVLGAWLLTHQYLFVRSLVGLDDALTVEQTVDAERVVTDREVRMTVSTALATPSPLAVTVLARPPVAMVGPSAEQRRIRLDPGDSEATTTMRLAATVAGSPAFRQSEVTARDRLGLFEETVDRGATPSLTVVPRAPRNLHVGEGGEELGAAFGEHDAGRLGSGVEPESLRRYVSSDPAGRIDWKATARLAEPYVREYEADTDRTTALLVDHRAAMATGPEGETKLDYAREVALAFLASTREADDPLGLYTVGDEGLTGRIPPEAGVEQYADIERRLRSLTATTAGAAAELRRSAGQASRPPSSARTAASALAGDTSPFGMTLRPFYAASRSYVQRIERDPLFRTAETALGKVRGSLWTVLLTDDTNPGEVRETVKFARRGDDRVLVFLTPTVLFDPGGLGDLERAYERYREFEEFRRSLARLDRVSAFEVAPGDRLAAVLGAQRSRRRREEVGR